MSGYKTILATWVPVSLAERLEELARERKVTRSQLIGDALSQLAFGKPLERAKDEHRNTDGRDAEAVAIIRDWSDSTVRSLKERLTAAGIRRGKDWITEKRREIRQEAVK